MAMYYNGKKVRNLYYNGKCITRLALGKEMTRLVEGDDFVRAEWLCGRNGAYINTMHPANTGEDAFIVKGRYDGTMRNPRGDEQAIFGVVEKWSSDDSIWLYTYISGANEVKPILLKLNAYSVFPDNVPLRGLTKEFVVVLKKSNSDYYAENNGQSAIFSNLGVTDKTIGNVYLFTRNTENIPTQAAKRYFQGDIAYFRITDPTFSIDRVNMFPCRLLRPIPATLDGNGIARNAGECGMFDAVSGKFYGNVASSGTFTVEPSLVEGVDYERHRWLVGDGSAYIDTLINKLKGTITVDIDRTAVTSNSNILGREAYPGLGYESRCVVNLLNNNIADIYGIRTSYGYGVRIDSIDTLYLDLDTKIASTKSGNSTSIDIGTDIGGYNMLLFAKNNGSTPSYCWRGGIGEFKMADVISLTPVRLLRTLPSYLDANGKARHQFECGMLDLKTMKFYGNVATTGNFTVSDN